MPNGFLDVFTWTMEYAGYHGWNDRGVPSDHSNSLERGNAPL